MRRALADLALAVAFLTVVPVPATGHGDADLGRAAAWFPLVGAAVGALAGAVRVATDDLLGAGPATVLALVVLVVVTGALHQDGLADTADGLGVRHDRARRLAVMRDSAVGVFGVLAVLVWALLFVTGLTQLDATDALLALVAAGALGRWAALLHAQGAPPARADGLGAGFRAAPAALATATVLATAVGLLAAGALPGLAALAVTLAIAALTTVWMRSALGGRTGDTLGATVALAEIAVILTLVAIWR
jgi:adenosylcobinamide-GDP ribazoletransferase